MINIYTINDDFAFEPLYHSKENIEQARLAWACAPNDSCKIEITLLVEQDLPFTYYSAYQMTDVSKIAKANIK